MPSLIYTPAWVAGLPQTLNLTFTLWGFVSFGQGRDYYPPVSRNASVTVSILLTWNSATQKWSGSTTVSNPSGTTWSGYSTPLTISVDAYVDTESIQYWTAFIHYPTQSPFTDGYPNSPALALYLTTTYTIGSNVTTLLNYAINNSTSHVSTAYTAAWPTLNNYYTSSLWPPFVSGINGGSYEPYLIDIVGINWSDSLGSPGSNGSAGTAVPFLRGSNTFDYGTFFLPLPNGASNETPLVAQSVTVSF